MPLLKRRLAFDDPNWIFELKYDGFRALAVVEHGRAQLISRNGHPFTSFKDLTEQIADSLPDENAVLDGEIVCLDNFGKPRFTDLLFHRADPCFIAFDLLMHDGKDLRREMLIDRKQELRRVVVRRGLLMYADHADGLGTALFEKVCLLDLEGIVAKQKHAPYVSDRETSTWFKIPQS